MCMCVLSSSSSLISYSYRFQCFFSAGKRNKIQIHSHALIWLLSKLGTISTEFNPGVKHCANGMHNQTEEYAALVKSKNQNRERVFRLLHILSFLCTVECWSRIKKMYEMKQKQNKTHKNGNLKINFHLNGYLHINATYKLRTIITVSVSLIFLLLLLFVLFYFYLCEHIQLMSINLKAFYQR